MLRQIERSENIRKENNIKELYARLSIFIFIYNKLAIFFYENMDCMNKNNKQEL